ncbi:MAG: hypothetical protein GX628_03205 [Clostridiales bacterium]|nr:hypothetical protein [Clostridiales bacterium]
MKKSISLLLVFAAIALCAACSGGGAGQSRVSTATTPETTELTTTSRWADSLLETDMDGAEVNVLTAAEQWQSFYNAEDSGEIVDSAVFLRNQSISERFNCEINYLIFNGYMAGMADVRTAITGSVMAGSGDYDLLVGSVSYITPLISANVFTDLNGVDYIDFSAPWWYDGVNSELEIAGRQYLAAGSYGLLNTAWSVVTFFNKNLAESHNIGDLYSLVLDGSWIYDRFHEICSNVTSDLDGNDVIDGNDLVGLVSTEDYIRIAAFSMGVKLTSRENGRIIFNEANDRLVKVNELIYNLYKSDWYLNTKTDLDYTEQCTLFAGDHAMFMTHRLSLAGGAILREMDGYGIIPVAKFDESQEKYLTETVAEICAIPLVVPSADNSALMLEALNAESYLNVRPVYYELALKTKYASDTVTGQMLDIICESARYDFVSCYSRIFASTPINLIGASENITSAIAENIAAWQEKIDSLTETVSGF